MNIETQKEAFYTAITNGKRMEASRLANELLSELGDLKALYEEVFKSSLYRVGQEWEQGRVSVATEHMASMLTEVLLNDLYPLIQAMEQEGKTVVVACVPGEQHEIGCKMVSDVFEMNQWNTLMVGANTPASDLLDFLQNHQPDVLALSAALSKNVPAMQATIAQVRTAFSDLPILIGGQALSRVDARELLLDNRVMYLKDLVMLDDLIKNSL